MNFSEFSLKAHKYATYPLDARLSYYSFRLCSQLLCLETITQQNNLRLNREQQKNVGEILFTINELCLYFDFDFSFLLTEVITEVDSLFEKEQELFCVPAIKCVSEYSALVARCLRDGEDSRIVSLFYTNILTILNTLILDYVACPSYETMNNCIEILLQDTFNNLLSKK